MLKIITVYFWAITNTTNASFQVPKIKQNILHLLTLKTTKNKQKKAE